MNKQARMHTHKNTVSDKTEGSTHVAREVVAGALAVELAEAVADVAAGLVVRHELLGLEAGGAGISRVTEPWRRLWFRGAIAIGPG